MSKIFSIKNKASFWGFKKAKIMKISEILSLIDDLSVYDLPYDPDNSKSYLIKSLNEFEGIQVGVEGVSSRTFELSYNQETECYDIRVFTPSTRADWHIAIHFMQNLAMKLQNNIIDEDNITYLADNINYDYEWDIRTGIAYLLDSDHKESTIFGIHHPFCPSYEQIDKIRFSKDQIKTFEELFYENQYVEAYFAKQMFYKDEHNIIGTYSLTQETPTILPYNAEVEFSNLSSIKNDEISDWFISIVIFKDPDNIDTFEVIGKLHYAKFIEKLPKEKYRYIDQKYILVDGLTQTELKNLL
ncbi:DUF4299 family protein [Muribacter muris]|uniref:DUF4299 family protein n=1 Tax=Muribacter muris TaxID=67855 RepID=A0A4Y9K251_9PAST|nr:DUF4299 family protein [Muribacter muris]MBF0784386.1 DUF4299 family protein [Muribacter muris]MBF0827932.1 DUF4299 family protein [Muribacter muris]TFV12161.1 DUF4299 family protein [Muribacter muris]